MLTIATGDKRLEIDYQGTTVAVVLAPVNLTSQLQSLEWARQNGLWKIEPGGNGGQEAGVVSAIAFDRIELLRRIKAWEGLVDGEGKVLPCTDEMKVLVFGQLPSLVNLIQEQIQAAAEAERKNSGPSQAG
jgi:hypothetical protein